MSSNGFVDPIVENAVGVLMVRENLSPEGARAWLIALAVEQGRSLYDIAEDIVRPYR